MTGQERIERYTYSSGFADERLNGNLLSITRPQEVEDGGPAQVLYEYGTDPADPLSFDKVTAHHVGGGQANASGVPAGGTITYVYEALNESVPLGDPAVPRGRVIVTQENGNQYEYYANELDHHIITRHLTRTGQGLPPLRPGEPDYYETISEFDADGQLIRRIRPETNEVVYTYDTNSGRRGARNLLEVREIADLARGGGEDLVQTFTYEPIFNQPLTRTDARGNATQFTPPNGGPATPERYTHRTTYDYQEASAAEIEALAADLDVELTPAEAAALSFDTDLIEAIKVVARGEVYLPPKATTLLLQRYKASEADDSP